MSKKDKLPWYKRIYGFIEDKVTRSFGSFIVTLFAAWGIFIAVIIIYGLLNPVNPADKIESTTTYSETSTVAPVYTHAKEGSDDFKKVIADLEFYNTKPEKTEDTQTTNVKTMFGSVSSEDTTSLIDGKDAESLYYHKGTSFNPLDIVDSLFGKLEENMGTLILYNKSEKTYTTHTVKGIKFSRNSSKNSVEVHYSRDYSDYQGAPKPVYSYSPTVELTEYKDGTYMWKYKDNWKIENEDEIKSYISSAPKKED